MGESTDAAGTLKDAVKFLADNLETILDTVGLLIKAFIVYKGTTIATTIATTAYRVATQTAAIATKIFSGNLKGATKGMKAFNAVTKLNPLGLLATTLLVVLPLLSDLSNGIDETNKLLDEMILAEEALDRVATTT